MDGGAGVDTVQYAGKLADYRVTTLSDGGTLQAYVSDLQQQRDGNDALRGVERLRFADGALALDMAPTQAGGEAALMLAAVLGPAGLADKSLAGAFLRFFDSGATMVQGAQLLLDSGLLAALAHGNDPSTLVNYVYNNVYGKAPDGGTSFLMATEVQYGSAAQWLAKLAASADNIQHVGLVGLAGTGWQYTP